jgi:preprotein translocase subunit SecG
MAILVLVIEIVLCLFSLFMIAVVLLQSGKSAGLSGDIAGGAETFLGKSKAKSYEGKLKKLTKVAAVGIMVLAVALVLIQVYVMPNYTGTDATPAATPTAQVETTDQAGDADAAPTVSPAE